MSSLEVCVFFYSMKKRIHQVLNSDCLAQGYNQQKNGAMKKEPGRGLKTSYKLSASNKALTA
jgi:hypothetical protein